jgi:probable O-glycosylation ligase (exosortase A-associated)
MLALFLVSILGVGGFLFMPEGWRNRMATILTPSEEGSASTRLVQWQYAIDISLERPLFGNGYDAFFYKPYYYRYVGGKDSNRAVHSNVFQVLGEQGYIGLAMYLGMWVMLVLSSKKYALLCKGRKDLMWAASLIGMVQFSVIGFAANGLTLNLAYLDLYFFILVFTVLLISHIRQELGLTQVNLVRRQNSMVSRSMRT